jgi:salicylate hydroxylase
MLTWTTFEDWNPVVKALVDLTPSARLYPNYTGDPLPTWTFGSRVTLVGDAAHTHGGAFAAGGSLALDDAYALSLAFRHVFSSSTSSTSRGSFSTTTTHKIAKALELYDRTRRPHAERLLKIVFSSVSYNRSDQTARSEDEENAALIKRMTNRADTTWLTEHDVEETFRTVVEKDAESQGQITGSATGDDS